MRRLNPFFMFRGHWKSLVDLRGQRPKAAWAIRTVILALPVGAFLWFGLACGELTDPGAILAALALLAGALLAAFSQLSNWRQTLTARAAERPVADQTERDHLDETASHLLVASYSSALASLFLVLAMNISGEPDGSVSGWWAASALGLSVYVLIVFLIAVPRLYSSYVILNEVRDELNGYAKPLDD